MRLFFAILFVSGYVNLPRRHLYWDNKADVHNEAVSNAMPRNKFDDIMKYIHCADNASLDPDDRFSKVTPMYNSLNARFLNFFPNEQNLSIDESMVPYYGRHSSKQFIRGKPIRFGYKLWVMATTLGYIVQIDPYQGNKARMNTCKSKGLGYSVVMKLISVLPPEKPFHVTFDNFFTSLNLISSLKEMGIGGTGTVRKNRLRNFPVEENELKRAKRGEYDFRQEVESGVLVCSWNDNSVVTVASNKHTVFPIRKVARYSVKEKAKVAIDQPNLIHVYNNTMGGTDRADQNISQYRISIRSKKWWWPLFAFLLDAAMNNAWLLHRRCPSHENDPLDQLSFRRRIVDVYLRRHRVDRRVGRPLKGTVPRSTAKRVLDEIRKDNENHFLESRPTQRRCAECGKKTMIYCPKCDLPVHRDCSKVFHTK